MHIKGRQLNRAVFLMNCTPFKNQAYSFFTSEEGGGSIGECLNRDCGFEPRWRYCVVSLSKAFYPLLSTGLFRERSGSVVECLTRDRRVAGSSLTGVTALWSLSKTHLS